ncbi:EamA family transporter [Coleofasciculus sp. E1-EBD-02]|uniref:EamA family transporter n=1 Tax=Coleofasciculus sp. E1-EBD-02 TaxID=3068481 RepID=UPI003300743E
MGQLDNQPDNGENREQQAADLLQSMTESIEGIETLRHSLITQFTQEIEQLQQEKAQLSEEIKTLHDQRQQHLTQPPALTSEITPAFANQLQDLLSQQLQQLAQSSERLSVDQTMGNHQQTIQELVASLDNTLRTTFRTLQQDLNSYQSSMSQQLSQMYSLQEQAEVILETLVNRLKAEIPPPSSTSEPRSQIPPAAPHPLTLPAPDQNGSSPRSNQGEIVRSPAESPLPVVPPTQFQRRPQKQSTGKQLVGLVLVLLSLLAIAFENVFVNIIFNATAIPDPSGTAKGFPVGAWLPSPYGGFWMPTLGNTLLVLWSRMLVVVPMAAILSRGFYRGVWRDIQQVVRSRNWGLFGTLLCSGFFLFLSKVLLYWALGIIAPGVAVIVFFIYPIVLLLLSDRFNRWSHFIPFAMVIAGFVLTTLPSGSGELSPFGVTLASGAAIAFALHLMLMQNMAKQLHPMPILLLNLAIVLIFSALGVMISFPASWGVVFAPSLSSNLVISGLVLGGVTLISYVCNTMGIARSGAASASVLGATLPILTALLAWILIQSPLTVPQVVGMVLVTLGVAALTIVRSRYPRSRGTM